MSKSARRPQRIYQILMWVLSIVFAGFLIGFGNLVIRDLPKVDRPLMLEEFVAPDALNAVDARIETLDDALTPLQRNVEDAMAESQSATADYLAAKGAFDNWISTRNATESDAQNPEVVRRTRALDDLRLAQRRALGEVEAAQSAMTEARRDLSDQRQARTAILDAGRDDYERAQRAQELRVFLYRLALTLPLLLVAGWLILRKRESAYWPLYRGFALFAAFAFFVELVPYLPHYGGYVRYAVGIVVVLIAGHFLIRGMRRYLDRKRAEEARSEVERRQSIEYETALKKIAAKTCPGCDRAIIERDGVATDFCVHCGIRLQDQCAACGQKNISFHHYCLACGTPKPEPVAGELVMS
ncbi:zinc ribbon domain-containing protein [uncultured Algimonas sp.]|uniref:zinc ribbon domain-containing protein n=1 Tax=uncultured Algimonas sp. TaxID=1547920 RepID=UPI0026071C9D|nr:zinc ribbon domain-containing protein [uncultured Algimonas sp.]